MKHNKKIYSLNTLASKISQLKSQGNTIILCHGVFDLLHIGHIKYFEEAKSFGSTLIVTITPDRFVNKGSERPVFSEKYRAEAIAALGSVDYVSINEWPTAIETIKLIKPDYYVKGPDYKDYKKDVTGISSLRKMLQCLMEARWLAHLA
jgi:rfaE bifunctional protein nucleotidyltransferase chain/domain